MIGSRIALGSPRLRPYATVEPCASSSNTSSMMCHRHKMDAALSSSLWSFTTLMQQPEPLCHFQCSFVFICLVSLLVVRYLYVKCGCSVSSVVSQSTVPNCQLFLPFGFRSNNPAHRYYLATDPVTGQLYVSDTNSRRIYRPKVLTGTKELIQNGEVVAGTGEQCPPFDEARCGDGGKATEALLMGPKGRVTEE